MPRITAEEHRERQSRTLAAMERAGIDCLVLLPGAGFRYLTGQVFMRERYRLTIAAQLGDGRLVLGGPTFEEQKLGSGPLDAEVITWTDEDDQYRLLGARITKAHGARARVALELTANHYHRLRLEAALPEARFVDPTPATERLRACKSPAEIDCLREAAARTRARMTKVPSQLREGMTERELAREFGPGAMVQFGLTTSLPNEVAGDRRLAPGDPIVIDAGDRVEGYRSDLTRTFCLGEPTTRLAEVHAVVEEAERAAIAAARPGAPAERIDLAGREVIEAAGYGAYFTHRGGHGLGLDFHELPLCVTGNREPLEPGMVLTAEPGIYLPGELGVRIEDDILITATGCELLSERGPFIDG